MTTKKTWPVNEQGAPPDVGHFGEGSFQALVITTEFMTTKRK